MPIPEGCILKISTILEIALMQKIKKIKKKLLNYVFINILKTLIY